jgi:hypothetical protein
MNRGTYAPERGSGTRSRACAGCSVGVEMVCWGMATREAQSALEVELRKAMAEALGRAGERLELAISRYRALKSVTAEGAANEQRLAAARSEMSTAREWLIIQREAIGLRRHDAVDEQFPEAAPHHRR